MIEIKEETRATKKRVRNHVTFLKKKLIMNLKVMMKKLSMLLRKMILMKMIKLH